MQTNKNRVVLIEPIGGMNFSPEPSKRGNSAPPYAIECLAGFLRDKGFDAEIIHQRPVNLPRKVLNPTIVGPEGDEEIQINITDDLIVEMICDKAKGDPAMVVGLSAISGLFNRSLVIARKVKLRNPEVKIVIGGYHTSALKEKVFRSAKLNAWEIDLRKKLVEQRLEQLPEDEQTDERRAQIEKEFAGVNLVDFFAVGEGEQTIYELASAIKEGKTDFSEISGVIYRETKPENGKVLYNEFKPRERIKPQEGGKYINLPPAYREMNVPVTDTNGDFLRTAAIPTDIGCTQFGSFPPSDQIRGEIQMSYSRGCPGNCSFCGSSLVWLSRLTLREPKTVVDEILKRRRERGTNFVYFADLTFNANLSEMEGLLKTMVEKGEGQFGGSDIDNIHWFCLARAFPIRRISKDKTREILRLMKEAGCSKIGFGVEGFTPEDFMRYKAPGREDQLDEGISRYAEVAMSLKMASDEGILTRGYFMWGDVGHDKTAEARATALTQVRIPESIFDNFERLKDVIRAVFELQAKEREGKPYTAEELEDGIKRIVPEEFTSETRLSRLLEIHHLRIAPLTPSPETSVARERKLRYFDCYKWDLTDESDVKRNGLLTGNAEKIGLVIRDARGNIIPKRETKDGKILEINVDKSGRVETDEKQRTIYYLRENDGSRKRVDQEFVDHETSKKVIKDPRTLSEATDESFDDWELFDQETGTIDPIPLLVELGAGDDYEIDEMLAFQKKELVDAFYGNDAYRESMQKIAYHHPELREALRSWERFWSEMGKEFGWELDAEVHSEFQGEFREGRPI